MTNNYNILIWCKTNQKFITIKITMFAMHDVENSPPNAFQFCDFFSLKLFEAV